MTYYDLDMNSKRINNCQDPSAIQDVATKNYVDTFNYPINSQSANYTLLASDNNKRIVMDSAGSTTITVNNSVFTADDTVYFVNKGAGTTTITAGAGVTINSAGGALALSSQYSTATLIQTAANVWLLSGGIG